MKKFMDGKEFNLAYQKLLDEKNRHIKEMEQKLDN
jgi:hypothetical protein